MKSEPPYGEVIYEQDDFVIHKVDGEEYKVRRSARSELSIR